jgi:hypothetical protein
MVNRKLRIFQEVPHTLLQSIDLVVIEKRREAERNLVKKGCGGLQEMGGNVFVCKVPDDCSQLEIRTEAHTVVDTP